MPRNGEELASVPPRPLIPTPTCVVSAALFFLSAFLPYNVILWSNSPDQYRLFWNWSGFGMLYRGPEPGFMVCFWLGSFLLPCLAALWVAAIWLGDRGRLWAAICSLLLYVYIRFPFDTLALPWPSGGLWFGYRGILGLVGVQFKDDPFGGWSWWRLSSDPNPYWSYLVLLRTLFTWGALAAPLVLYVRRRFIRHDPWMIYIALTLAYAYCLPFASDGGGRSAWNWSPKEAFGSRIETGWFMAGGALLPILALSWVLCWATRSRGFVLAILGVGAWSGMRLHYDVLSLADLPGHGLRPVCEFMWSLWIVLRTYLEGLGVFYPLLRTARERFRLPNVCWQDTVLHALASAMSTWVMTVASFGRVTYHCGPMVGFDCALREPVIYALIAPLPALIGYWLFSLGGHVSFRGAPPSKAREIASRIAAIAWSAIVLPFLMLALSHWFPYLI